MLCVSTFNDVIEFIALLRSAGELAREEGLNMKKSQKWITENFGELVARYGGKYAAIVGEKVVAVAFTPKEAMEEARKIARVEEISLLKVPSEEELICIL